MLLGPLRRLLVDPSETVVGGFFGPLQAILGRQGPSWAFLVWETSQARPVATPADSSLCVTLKAHASLRGVLRPCALCRRHPTGGGYSRLVVLPDHPSHRLSAALPELRDRRCQSLRVFATSFLHVAFSTSTSAGWPPSVVQAEGPALPDQHHSRTASERGPGGSPL